MHRIPEAEAERRVVQPAADAGGHARLHGSALGPIIVEHVNLGAARIPKDGEPLHHLKPVSPSISRRLPDLLRA
jgi:hypothetical protein